MWPSTPAERRHLACRCRTCCLRRFRASRPPQSYLFRGSIPHPIRSLCTLRIRRCRRLRNTRFPAARYHLTGADLSPAETRQLRLTHRNRKFESISLPAERPREPDRRRGARAPVQRLADRMAGYLVYFALGAAALTFLITRDVRSTVSVVIVAGACGIAAGTPLAILGGIGRAARLGAIIKGGLYLESLGRVDTIVLDKTGTLTFGRPEVQTIVPTEGVSP